MRTELLGLELDKALNLLKEEGLCPQVQLTRSPRRKVDEGGTLRVVSVKEDVLTAARFFDPIPAVGREGA